MRASTPRLAVLGLLLTALPALCAGYERTPTKEEMLLNGHTVVVDYRTSATSNDLLLPFYEGARVETSLLYKVTTKDGKPVLYYAAAELATGHAPGRVAEYYRGKLPGKPKPETIAEKRGKRLVLAVGTEAEVRMVTITQRGSGSRIQLVRATKPAIPQPPKEVRPERPPGRSPRRGMRRGMRA